MAAQLAGRRIAFLATHGVERVELTEPWAAAREAGAETELVSPREGEVLTLNHLERAEAFRVDRSVEQADPERYDALVLPGGVVNADALRTDPAAVRFVRAFFEAGKPVAVICHGPWILIEAGVVKGRTLTSWPSLRTDLENAGARWVDEEVHVDRGLVSSRKPADLPAFCAKLVEEVGEGGHRAQAEAARRAAS